MLVDLWGQLGSFIHTVFISQLSSWVLLGWFAQALFTARFLVQWVASERAGKSVVPVAFWVFSVLGGALLLVYAIWRQDPVFIVGQGAGLFIYARNLWFIQRERSVASAASSAGNG